MVYLEELCQNLHGSGKCKLASIPVVDQSFDPAWIQQGVCLSVLLDAFFLDSRLINSCSALQVEQCKIDLCFLGQYAWLCLRCLNKKHYG